MAVTRLDADNSSMIVVAGRMIVLGAEDADRVIEEVAGVLACWVDPAPPLLWAAVCRALGLDPELL